MHLPILYIDDGSSKILMCDTCNNKESHLKEMHLDEADEQLYKDSHLGSCHISNEFITVQLW